MQDQTFTVMMVPERGSRVLRLTLSGWHVLAVQQLARLPLNTLRVRLAAAGALALIAGMVGMTWQYLSMVGRVHEDTAVREENLELKARLATLQEKIDHVNEVLARTKHLYANLQNVAQLSDPDRKLALGEDTGEEDPREAVDPQKLADRLDQINAEAQSQEESLQALTGYFEDRKALLASAPAIWPARGWVTSDFGYRLDPYTSQRKSHVGLDIANVPGTQVVAPATGTVVYAAAEAGYGNVIVLDHGFGLKTRYAHLAKIDVRLGSRVQRGQPIGAIGNTGRSTGPHLHYEVRVNGVPENPRKFILETDEPDDPAQRGFKATGERGYKGAMGGGGD
jgi:murein DD-endopeptidase MepM/ murein hydrolase activator NlpD